MSLQAAIRMAALKHGESTDKGGQPFIGHPLRVMARISAKFPEAPEWVLEAAVLHDVFEDTGTDPMECDAYGVSMEGRMLALVLTRDDAREGYFDYIARVKTGAVAQAGDHVSTFAVQKDMAMWATRIKIEDLGDNLNPQRRVAGMKLPERYERALAMLRG